MAKKPTNNLRRTIMPGGLMDQRHGWYAFRIFNYYRLILAAMLLGVFLLNEDARLLGADHPLLFLGTAAAYMVAVVATIITSHRRRPPLPIQVHIQTLVDIVALSLLAHASGGSASGLSILLVPAVAASGILLPLISSLLAALLAFMLVLGDWLLERWFIYVPDQDAPLSIGQLIKFTERVQEHSDDLVRLGMLGASFAIAALLTHTLAERVRKSDELARQSNQELLEMAELNQAIVQHLQSGIIVVDRFARVRLINDTAAALLNYHESAQGIAIGEISPLLSQRLAAWLSSGLNNPKPFRQDDHLPDLSPSFTHLSGNRAYDTLIFLEDSTQAAQRLQQIKLAALGRLTASIAHEIRNPLASISHAAQLLQESPTASAGDRRLGQIIHENARRANEIIVNVLDLSKRDKAKPENVTLKSWLEDFAKEFIRGQGEPPPHIDIGVAPENLTVRFDPNQLRQVLWNLCVNACRHGTSPSQPPRIRLAAGPDAVRGRTYLDVIDFGPGIPEAEAKNIFEPFFTTQTRGTGLGLYISREICEANRAQLQYLRPPRGGSCFRIIFSKPSRQDAQQWKLAAP